MISTPLRDLLIEHIDGPVAVRVADCARYCRIHGAVRAKLLTFDRPRRPRQTAITERGRAALAEALADWADALSRAQQAKAWPESPPALKKAG